jgi:aryl-alcohol dehydrogenase-like predicted oxidoreductase
LQYTTFKDTRLSRIGFGCYALSGAYGRVDVDQFVGLIHRAIGLGVTFFDTASAYGDAERVLGKALGQHRRQAMIETKVGVKEGLKPILSRQYVVDACDASLGALGTDYIDLYQVHFDDHETPVEETVAALDELQGAGKIRHYGVGHLAAERVCQYCDAGDVFSVLMELSAVETSARERLLPLCREREVGAIAFSVTGRGVLAGRFGQGTVFDSSDIRSIDPLFQRERFRSALRTAEIVSEIARTLGRTPAQIAIAWVLAQPGVICALTGPSTVPHLEENVAAANVLLLQAHIERLEDFLREEQVRLRREQRATVHRILRSPLSRDSLQAFKDLVYAVETSLVLGFASEDTVMPVFRDLLALRKQLDGAGPRLSEIQARFVSLVRRGLSR